MSFGDVGRVTLCHNGSLFALRLVAGQVDQGEQCDDGNVLDADGCSAECKVHFATGPGSQNTFALDVGTLSTWEWHLGCGRRGWQRL